MKDEDLGKALHDAGWRTGSVLPTSSHEELSSIMEHPGLPRPEVAPNDWLVVVSQTCDLVAPKEAAEPFVEVLHCGPIPKLRSGYKEIRSTRYLDFRPNKEAFPDIVLNAHASRDRYFVPRSHLLTLAPDSERVLSSISVARITAWLSLRYGRPAWPNEVVRRLQPVKKELESILEPLRDDIAEVRVAFAPNDQELAPSDAYQVAVWFVVDEESWLESPEIRASAQEAFRGFVSALKSCDGFSINEEISDVVSGAAFTWQQTKMTDEWNFANLSYLE